MTPEEAMRMLDEAFERRAKFIRLHPDTIAALRREYPQDPTVPQFLRPAYFGTPVVMDPSVAVGAWELDL